MLDSLHYRDVGAAAATEQACRVGQRASAKSPPQSFNQAWGRRQGAHTSSAFRS